MRKKEYELNPTVNMAINLFNALRYCGKMYVLLLIYDKAEEKYSEMLKLSKSFTELFLDECFQRCLSISLNSLGEIAKETGNSKKAAEYYLEALEISKDSAQNANTIETRRDILFAYYRIAQTVNDISEAESNCMKALEIA